MVCEEPVKSMHLRDGTKCYWLVWDNDWLGAWVPRVCSWNGRTIGGVWSMNSLMKHYWWLRIVPGIDLAGIYCLWLSSSCTGCRLGRVAKWLFIITPVLFFDFMDDWRPFLASSKFYVLWKRTYAISLYRCVVCIYSGRRGQIEIFDRETSRSLA